MTTDRPLVSIISPSLNSRLYLPRLLACLESQTYQPLEHIIVDGLSTDGSKELLQHLDMAKHRVIFHQDRSMYEAINRGIQSAQGEIIGYLNVDDLYFPRTIETVVDYFTKYPLADIVFGDVISTNQENKSFVMYCYSSHQYSLSRIALDQSIGQPSVFFRRRVVEAIGLFDEQLQLIADLEYWMRASKKQLRFQKINRFLSLDCRHSGMLRLKREKQLARELAHVRQQYFQYPAWQKVFFTRRNYWGNIVRNKILEFTAHRRFLPCESGKIVFDQTRYRRAFHRVYQGDQSILSIRLPYFEFEGVRLDGLSL